MRRRLPLSRQAAQNSRRRPVVGVEAGLMSWHRDWPVWPRVEVLAGQARHPDLPVEGW